MTRPARPQHVRYFNCHTDPEIPKFLQVAIRADGAFVNVAKVRFANWIEYVNASTYPVKHNRERSSRDTGRDWFFGTRNWEEAYALATDGWAEGVDKLTRSVASMANGLNVERPQINLGLEGGAVDVPLYLSGERECMWSWSDTKQRKAVRLVVDVANASHVTAEQVMFRGAAIVSLADALESGGYATEILGRFGSWDNHFPSAKLVHEVTLKRTDEPLDIATLAFVLAHPSSQRRICWSVRETSDPAVVKMFGYHGGSGYGTPLCSSVEDGEPGDILLNRQDAFETEADAIRWVQRIARDAGVELEIA